ncbi:MAG TPA: hypothetical protein VK151_02265 [Fluviicola sp.]|nr:hypothetical protein [Fluviicola sp.]
MNKILVFLLIITYSCSSDNQSVISHSDKVPDYSEIRKKHTQYVLTHNKSALKESYSLLKKNSDFKTNGLSDSNKDLVLPIYMELKKYDDLLDLIHESRNLNEYHKTFYDNYITYLKFRCIEGEKATFYIEKNLSLIKEKIKSSPNDSSLLVDYFFNKVLITNVDSLHLEIDSMKKNRVGISSEFYDHVLKESIREFSIQIPDCP